MELTKNLDTEKAWNFFAKWMVLSLALRLLKWHRLQQQTHFQRQRLSLTTRQHQLHNPPLLWELLLSKVRNSSTLWIWSISICWLRVCCFTSVQEYCIIMEIFILSFKLCPKICVLVRLEDMLDSTMIPLSEREYCCVYKVC